jgi:hypothetical protein
MPTIKLTAEGKIITKGGLPSCTCCGEAFELAITYDWRGTGQYDLDTHTSAFGEACGWSDGDGPVGFEYSCGEYGTYVAWLAGGSGAQDDQSLDGFERVDVRVDKARTDGLWTSSYNIECFAGWYDLNGGSGPFLLTVTYKGDTKTESISDPGTSTTCATTPVATIIVYSTVQGDGTFFEIA